MSKKTKVTKEKSEGAKCKCSSILTYKQKALLYFICGSCWIVSAVLNSIAGEKPWVDLIIGLVLITVGVLCYFKEMDK